MKHTAHMTNHGVLRTIFSSIFIGQVNYIFLENLIFSIQYSNDEKLGALKNMRSVCRYLESESYLFQVKILTKIFMVMIWIASLVPTDSFLIRDLVVLNLEQLAMLGLLRFVLFLSALYCSQNHIIFFLSHLIFLYNR